MKSRHHKLFPKIFVSISKNLKQRKKVALSLLLNYTDKNNCSSLLRTKHLLKINFETTQIIIALEDSN
jgi:hypothetical protein